MDEGLDLAGKIRAEPKGSAERLPSIGKKPEAESRRCPKRFGRGHGLANI